MATGDLFELDAIKQCRKPLSPKDREKAAGDIARLARYGAKHFYTLKEAAAILRYTYDEILTVISEYR
jgi:hypothetical protein